MAAKLLENRPASEVDANHPHARLVVVGAVLVLILGLGVGLWLIRPSNTEPEAVTEVTLVTWTEAAGQICQEAAETHPVLAGGAEARQDPTNLANLGSGVSALTARIRELDLPTDPAEAARVGETIRVGDEASRAWAALSGTDASADEVGNAATLTNAYVGGLTDLGADCSVLN